MAKTLHILNGDATAFVFKETKIEGDVLVWREILSEGPVSLTDLWKIRASWLSKTYGGEANQIFKDLTLIASQLQLLDAYEEVILWFEYDLVCQINLIYILSQLNNLELKNLNIYLICPATITGRSNFRGLGELEAQELLTLLSQKQALHQADLAFATRAWNTYVLNDLSMIEALLHQDFGNIPLLKHALKAHLKLFPSPETGLNLIEQTLQQIVNSGITSKKQIYESFWAQEPIYGLGDLQLDLVLQQLEDKGLIASL